MKKSIYIYNDGELKRKDNTLTFKSGEANQKSLPIENISEIFIMSEMNLNTKLINLISQHKIIIHFFNYYNFYIGSFYPKETLLAGEVLVSQVDFYKDNTKRLYLAKEFIKSAFHNIYKNIKYYDSRGKDLEEILIKISEYKNEIENCRTINELMGIEGNIRKVYYKSFNIIINQNIDFTIRVKRPPDNMINTLISFVNGIIYSKVLKEIYLTQLNPTISFLHEPGVRRFSLALDISEIFKPIIGDKIIFSMLNKNQITEDDFTEELNFLHLKKEASQKIMNEIDKKLETTIHHKDLGREVSYQYLIRLECYKLIKHIINEKRYESFKMWW